jgi:hypothetical protein
MDSRPCWRLAATPSQQREPLKVVGEENSKCSVKVTWARMNSDLGTVGGQSRESRHELLQRLMGVRASTSLLPQFLVPAWPKGVTCEFFTEDFLSVGLGI